MWNVMDVCPIKTCLEKECTVLLLKSPAYKHEIKTFDRCAITGNTKNVILYL